MKTLTLIRTAILTALDGAQPVEVTVQWGLGAARYEHPRIIVQVAGQGTPKRYIGMPLGWQGEIAVRAQAPTIDAAQTILTAAALPASIAITDADYAPGWSLRLTPDRPIPGLTGAASATIGTMYRAMLLPVMP